MRTPSLAIAEPSIAICSGVARTSNWPMPDIAVCALSGSVGRRDGVTFIGIDNESSHPKARAFAAIASHPNSMARFANGVLHEC